ncbi:THAP domain-containing protein 2 isoform X2 [Cephus cinctus]|uniref:THAP domain-containing protein 2 isoform X2 n=1 Tax=Cephus cinctus TaxID=211228 RepID=A0AAJ7R7T3_CEPCN|nr:THAP domain-containing protein 2 isoform X2 [Cephus cinctus]
MVYTCFICKKRSDKSQGLSFHRFPSNTTNRQQWLDILGKSKDVPGKGAAICSSHFDSKSFRYGLVNGKEFLKPGSKPTLNLRKQDQTSVAINISNKIDESFTNNRSDNWNSISSQLITNIPNDESLLDSQSNNISNNQLVEDLSIEKRTILNKRRQDTPLSEVITKKKKRLTEITWEELSKSSKQGEMLWEIAKQELINHRKKMECLQRKVRRLRQKVSSLKLLTYKAKLLYQNKLLECKMSFKQTTY